MNNVITPLAARATVAHSRDLGSAMYGLTEVYSPDNAMWQSKRLDLITPKYKPTNSYWWDQSRYQNHGTITGAIWKQLDSGVWVMDFDGVDDYVDCGNAASLMLTGNADISIMAWFNPDDFGNHNVIYMYGAASASNKLQLYTSQTDGYLAVVFYANDHITTTVVTAGAWHHVAVSVTGTTSKLYLDGVLVSTKSDHAAINILSGNAYIGNENAGAAAHDCDGSIALLSVHNRVIPDSEVRMWCNGQRHLFGV